VAPGTIRSAENWAARARYDRKPEMRQKTRDVIHSAGAANPRRGGAVLYLLSTSADYVTGQVLGVDGARLPRTLQRWAIICRSS